MAELLVAIAAAQVAFSAAVSDNVPIWRMNPYEVELAWQFLPDQVKAISKVTTPEPKAVNGRFKTGQLKALQNRPPLL